MPLSSTALLRYVISACWLLAPHAPALFPLGATFNTRAFDGDLPGPTLIMARNATNKANLVNALAGPDAAHAMNTFGLPSSTNIHTHGLHIPHQIPGDDVKIVVPPGTTYNYEWPVPADHAPGTHWYHPHLHGSTALQTGGGAHGMILVEDAVSDPHHCRSVTRPLPARCHCRPSAGCPPTGCSHPTRHMARRVQRVAKRRLSVLAT